MSSAGQQLLLNDENLTSLAASSIRDHLVAQLGQESTARQLIEQLNDTQLIEFFEMDGQPPRNLFQNLYYFYMPFCVFVGLTGNTMVWILIRSNRMLSKLPTNTYLLCLAAMSSIFLLSLMIFWIEEVAYIYFYDIFHDSLLRNSYYSCIFNTFLAHVCDFASVWLIVLVGFERLILLFRKNKGLTVERAQAHIVILLAVAMIFNSWILLVADMDHEGQCDIKEKYIALYKFMTVLETFVCMALPSFIILVSNVLVIVKLTVHLKKHPIKHAVSFNTTDLDLTTQTSAPSQTAKSYTRISSRFSIDVEGVPKKDKKKKGKKLRYADIQLTRSLLAVTSAFIMLNLPNYVYRISSILFRVSDQTEAMQKISLLAHVFLYTHHAFLFYLYIFYSPQMKRRLKPTALKLLECYCFKPSDLDHT